MALATGQLRIVQWAIWITAIVVAVSFVGGLAAAAFGGPFTGLGSGAGGLYAVPSLVLSLAAVAVGVPAGIIVARHLRPELRWLRAGVIAGGGLWVVAIGYFMIAHWVDPCVNGWWGPETHIGSQPLCERFGNELNWHTRFHLLAHAAPAAVLAVGYIWAIRRWVTPQPEPDRSSRHVGR